MIRPACTVKPLKLSIIPMVTAGAAAIPNLSKKRISRARRAAVAGSTRAMNWIPYCSMRTGTYFSFVSVEPMVENASDAWTNGDRASAMSTMARLADESVSTTVCRSTPANAPTSV